MACFEYADILEKRTRMRRTALAMLMIGGMAAWGQARNDTPGGAVKVDRATAYYHFTLAHMYAHLAAASGGRNREYVNKAIENHRAAVKADPQTPMLKRPPLFAPHVLRPPASRQDQ